MSSNRFEITLLSSGRRLHANEGETLFRALARSGVQLRSECGGKGVCGRCLVAVQERRATYTHRHIAMKLGSRPVGLVQRLACQWEIHSNLAVEIAPTSLAPAEVSIKPTMMRRFSPARSLTTPASPRSGYGLAVDLGTTTIALFLCDLTHGTVVASASVRNPQLIFGADVMSRISSVASDRANLDRMQELAVAAVNQSVQSLADQSGIEADQIVECVVVGNTCMIHLFLGVDPSSIGTYPYQPAFTSARQLAPVDLGLLGLHPEARLHTLPLVSGFLGCDVVAAAMATDLDLRDGETLLLDVGTNGEVMMNVGGELSAASCATGPALEGATITHGMHAISGAVHSISIDPRDGLISYSLIQRNPEEPTKAAGICGSGIISAVAALLKAGIILKSGWFNPESIHPNLRHNSEGQMECVLVSAAETQSGVDITVTQEDIRAVQFAKGALRAGIALLCREAESGLPRRLLMAGAFGTSLNTEDAMTIGLLPPLAENAVETVGNAAGEGAIVAMLQGDSTQRAEEIARRTRVVDLASHPDFQTVFLNSLGFPDPGQ